MEKSNREKALEALAAKDATGMELVFDKRSQAIVHAILALADAVEKAAPWKPCAPPDHVWAPHGGLHRECQKCGKVELG